MNSNERFELVRQGAKEHDDVEIVHYEPQFAPGSKPERRMVRFVSWLFILSGLLGLAFVACYIWWPFTNFPYVTGWEYEMGNSWSKGYTPVLGLTLGLSLILIGFAVLVWGKKLLPHEVALQGRHDGGSDPEQRKITGATLQFIGEEMGLSRRP